MIGAYAECSRVLGIGGNPAELGGFKMRETVTEIMQGVPVKGGTKPRRVANNTVHYIRPDGCEVWRLHHTDIVTKRPDGLYVLNSGGWRTSTTKDRINAYAPVRLYQHKHEWFLAVRAPDGSFDWNASPIPFEDHMTVDASGRPHSWSTDDNETA